MEQVLAVPNQLTVRKPTAKGKLSSHPLKKKQNKKQNKIKPSLQDKMLRIPNGCRNANQNDNGKSDPTTHKGHCQNLTSYKYGRQHGRKRIP